ncbi:MAG: adenylate/guanylate cyclase domain-containing protein [Spirochaetia bacterium]|nr:adenylate/guanylate cyclase domain-containing protein [Spirochaetia bacterium]
MKKSIFDIVCKNKISNSGIFIFLFLPIFVVLPANIHSQVMTDHIIDLRTKSTFGTPHSWQFKPGDSKATLFNENMQFYRAAENLKDEEQSGWISNFPVQLAYTRYQSENQEKPFSNFNEYFLKYHGYAWYRTTFKINQADFKNKFKSDHIVLRLGKIGQADAVYLNGTFIGGTGLAESTPPDTILDDKFLFYDKERLYKIPRDLLHLNSTNTIAIRTFAKYYIAPGLSHGKFYIASDRKVERSEFWGEFKKIFVISLMVLLGIYYLYWQFLFRDQGYATLYFALGTFAMAVNTLMTSQIIYSIYLDSLWIKKWEYISFICVVHLILDFFIKFSKVETGFIKKIIRFWDFIAVLAIIILLFIPDMVTTRRFMFAWGVLPFLVMVNIVYVIVKGRKIPSMGTVTGGLLGMLILSLNDVLVGFQFSWVTWENSLQDYAYAFFGISVAGSIVSNMVKSKNLVEKQREEKKRLSRYFSPDVMETIIANEMEMGGQEKPIATLFADISGFTNYSEHNSPAKVVEKLNLVFEKLSNVIFEHGATLDKYIGDCIMAFWGAPYSTNDDAYKAVACAFHMQNELKALTEKLGTEEMPFRLRIGVNYGPSIVGNIGSTKRMDYTVIGDAVNTASRIESNGIPGKVGISEATYSAAGGEQYLSYSEIKEVLVKGKSEPVKIYIIDGVKEKKLHKNKKNLK